MTPKPAKAPKESTSSSGFLRGIATFGGFTLLSRFTGLARDIGLSFLLGSGAVADAFFLAYRLPNLFRAFLAEGAFASAFTPVYAHELECKGLYRAARTTRQVLIALTFMLFLLTGIALYEMEGIITGLAPGFGQSSGQFALAVSLGRTLFPYLGLISLTALLGSVLQNHGRFGLSAFAPIVLNLCLIFSFGLFLLGMPPPSVMDSLRVDGLVSSWVGSADDAIDLSSPQTLERLRLVYWLALGVLVAGVAQLSIMGIAAYALVWPGATPDSQTAKIEESSANFSKRLQDTCRNLHRDPHQEAGFQPLMQFFRLLPYNLASAGALQVNLLIGTAIASGLGTGAISALYYADRLAQLPLGVVGAAIGVSLLPGLSRFVAREAAHQEAGNSEEARHVGQEAQELLKQAILWGIFLAIPAAVGLMILPELILRGIFGGGAFGPDSVRLSAWALAGFAPGMVAAITLKALQPAFFSRRDTRTPFLASVGTIPAYAFFAILLSRYWGPAGIATAWSINAWFVVLILTLVLIKRGHLDLGLREGWVGVKIFLAALSLGCVEWFALHGLLSDVVLLDKTVAIFWMLCLVTLGVFVYLLVALLLGLSPAQTLARFVHRKFSKTL